MRTPRRLRPLGITLLVTLGGLALVVVLAYGWGQRRELQAQSQQASQQLDLYAQALTQRIDRYRALPEVLALDPELRQAVAAPMDAATRERINRRLEDANRTTRSATLTLIDRNGMAVAASNWRLPTSNVGQRYDFRPYVIQAMREGHGRFYGIGVTTGVAGYFLSEAVRDADGRVLGVIAIKIELSVLEQEWLRAPDTVLVSDDHGIVFLSSAPEWRYRLLRPLDPLAQQQLRDTRQYEGQGLRPFEYERVRVLDDGGEVDRIREPRLSGLWLWQREALPDSGWTLHLLHDASGVKTAGQQSAIAAGLLWLTLVFVSLFMEQRRRLTALRLRSRQELENLVKRHAEELRTQQDTLVAVAQQADTGLSRRLEHLPQGVVIIDAELRLVAWNSRYIDLFRFPSGLAQVGRPIEDIFRYNARRGLLGPGPIEDAIARRLEHLRSGKPHMRESEKEDGTVLEIRGNPLPDGGFVTSYADITSYKNTARDLRSLADALEQRIVERTADLEQARQEAEQANRYKTRFVASAVHDLLQPLNAARMFVSALRGRLQDAEARDVADRVEGALAAQDAILASLLDISRLESGTLQTRVHDFALHPLLDALAREMGMLAQARGLRLDYVPTHAVVRSDPMLLRRIVQNFLSNAVRYTARGRIVLGCRREGEAIRIEVHDTGPGIPSHRQREIFEEFRRLDDAVAAERGAGLGLAIVERIGRLLQHRVSLRSTLGRGSVFAITLPQGDAARIPAAPADAPVQDDSLLRGCVVWCVDDDPRVCEATRTLLERWGCRVPVAAGPDEALAMAAPATAPQLVLLDLRMGELRGPDVHAALVQRWGRSPQVILITAEQDADTRALARENDWGFLAKPVKPPALRALMTQLLLRRGVSGEE